MRKLGIALLSALLFAGGATHATAQQTYPTKPVRIVVPYAPGGTTDIVARTLGEQMREKVGQTFVVENKTGAFGILAIEEMARSRPDGYTLMLGNVTTNATTPVLYADKFSIKYEQDVVPVMRLVDLPGLLVTTTKNFEPKTFAALVDHIKANPGKVRYSTTGIGSYPHFDFTLLAKRAGLNMIHIPNKSGAAGSVNDVITGDAQISLINIATAMPLVKAGQLRAVAIVSDKRSPELPDVPTMTEAGFPGIGTVAWQGLYAPAGTPKDVLEALHRMVSDALQSPRVVEAFNKQQFRIVPTRTLEEAQAWSRSELETWKTFIAEANITVE
jgi:tripartite-type tricarboxylate transporter receptor subunit TctC